MQGMFIIAKPMPYILYRHFIHLSLSRVGMNMSNSLSIPRLSMCSAVNDVDGDIVRCRWAESTQEECGGVCQAFPAELDQVCR